VVITFVVRVVQSGDPLRGLLAFLCTGRCYNVSNMKTIAITIEDDVLNRIDSLAGNRSEFIRKAVHDYLAHIETLEEEQRERKIFRQNRERLRREAIALIKEQAKP
jgi:hypothetical protein